MQKTLVKGARWIGLGLIFLVMLVVGLFSILTVYYSNLPWAALRGLAAAAVTVLLLLLGWNSFRKNAWKARGGFLGVFVGAWIWWLAIPAKLDRDWKEEVKILATAEFDGDLVTVRNMRNFTYRADKDFDAVYYDKTFDLSKIRGVDFTMSNWGLKQISHTLLSFEFEGGNWLTVSVETRLEKGEEYDAIQGAFKRFELIYVVGDERDLVRVRTNFRDETVHLYPSNASRAQARALFVSVLKGVNRTAEDPVFYRTLGRNCTTVLVDHVNDVIDPDVSYSLDLLLTASAVDLAYDLKLLDRSIPLADLKLACDITAIAKANGDAPDFSAIIRKKRDEAIAAAKK